MCLVFPKLRPLWLAPLLDPYWRLMMVWPALSLSSLKLRMFFSASFGPMLGAPNWPPCKTENVVLTTTSKHHRRPGSFYRRRSSIFLLIRSSYLSAQRLQANDHRVQILAFPQVNGLECLLGRHAHGYGHGQKVIDVFHAFESHRASVHFLHGTRDQGVHQSVRRKNRGGFFIGVLLLLRRGRAERLANARFTTKGEREPVEFRTRSTPPKYRTYYFVTRPTTTHVRVVRRWTTTLLYK